MNLISKLESLRAREHEATVQIVRSLLDLEESGEHLQCGYSGIWDFLVRHLNYSNAAASRRYKAMQCVRKFPVVLDMLRKHQTNLSALAMSFKTLDAASDPDALLGEIAGKSQRQVEQIVARRNPRASRRERVRHIAVRKKAVASSSGETGSAAEVELHAEPTSAAKVEDRVHLSFDVSTATHADLERAKAILSRKSPEGVTLELLMQELLATFLAKHAPKPPREPKKKSKNPRHIPQATRDAVFERDQHRCTYVGPTGVRCGSTHDLELDPIEPFALGGGDEPANLRLLCAKHNRHRARRTFARPTSQPHDSKRHPASTVVDSRTVPAVPTQ